MNREHWVKMLPIITAFVGGKTVQFRVVGNKIWDEYGGSEHMLAASDIEFRIKPEPKLRPWKPEEVPVGGVVRSKSNVRNVQALSGITEDEKAAQVGTRGPWSFQGLLESWERLDGRPCGVEVSE